MKYRSALKGADIGIHGSFMLYASTAVATPMALLPMAQEFSLSFTGGGAIEIARSLLILGMLLFSGYAAARWGKVGLLSLGLLTVSAGLFAYAAAPGYWMVLLAMGLIGLGGGLVEALINPLVHDLHPDDAAGRLNHANAYFSLGVCLTVLGAGELLTRGFSWRIIFLVLGTAGLLLTVLFTVSGRNLKLSKSNHSAYHVGQILTNRRFWILGIAMFCGGALEGAFTFWSASYLQLYFDALPRGAGVGTALFAGGMAAGRMGVARLTRIMGLRRIIMASALLGIIVGIGAYMIEGIAAFFVLLAAAGLSVACYWPTIQIYAAQTMHVDSTLLFIYLSCFGIPGFGLTPVIMGSIADFRSLAVAFGVVPVFSLLLILIMAADRNQTA